MILAQLVFCDGSGNTQHTQVGCSEGCSGAHAKEGKPSRPRGQETAPKVICAPEPVIVT